MRTRASKLTRWSVPLAASVALGFAVALFAQQTAPSAPQPTPAQQTPAQPAQSPAPAIADQRPSPTSAPAHTVENAARTNSAKSDAAPISEDEIRHQLVGKTFYLRGGYLDENLHFTDNGQLDGNSPRASYTLSLVEVDRVHLDKHHLELEGVRYGLHFLGAAPFEDQAVDRVRLTSKKKPLRITIDREEVVTPKKEKPPREDKKKHPAQTAAKPAPPQPASAPDSQSTPDSAPAALPAQQPAPAMPSADTTRHGAVVTASQAHANQTLRQALDTIFAAAIDQRMIATLPAYWQLYYKDVDAKRDYHPSDPSVLRQSQVDQKARLISVFDPQSNDFAQKNGVAGMSMYHVVVEPDGKPGEIAIGRPIGFGLDENAVDAIRKAKFEPAMKNGKPVPVLLDVVVEFRIYSKLTDAATAKPATGPEAPILPGPYSVNQPKPAVRQ